MKLNDPYEICDRLFKNGDFKDMNHATIIDGITYLINQKWIQWIEFDTNNPHVLCINPSRRRDIQALAEVMCWRPTQVTWECETENKDFTMAAPIRSVKDMMRPKDNQKQIFAKLMAGKGAETDDLNDMVITRNGLFVRIEWR